MKGRWRRKSGAPRPKACRGPQRRFEGWTERPGPPQPAPGFPPPPHPHPVGEGLPAGSDTSTVFGRPGSFQGFGNSSMQTQPRRWPLGAARACLGPHHAPPPPPAPGPAAPTPHSVGPGLHGKCRLDPTTPDPRLGTDPPGAGPHPPPRPHRGWPPRSSCQQRFAKQVASLPDAVADVEIAPPGRRGRAPAPAGNIVRAPALVRERFRPRRPREEKRARGTERPRRLGLGCWGPAQYVSNRTEVSENVESKTRRGATPSPPPAAPRGTIAGAFITRTQTPPAWPPGRL